MSIQTPTTKELSDNIIASFEATLNQSTPLLPKSFLRVLAKVLAGVWVILYKYGGFILLQQFVRTASDQPTEINGQTVTPLDEWGELVGIGAPAAATKAELLIDITVENQVGVLPPNSQLLNSSNGVTYLTSGAVALNAPVVQAVIVAASDQSGGDGSGSIGNLEPGAVVTFANPLANVAREATVVSQVVTGSDAESADAYRQRILDKFQKRPQGGAYADYEQWAEEPPGILNAYPYTSDCPGQVDVYIEATPESSGSPDGIPTPAQLQEALDSINFDQNGLATRRPANALANTFAITRRAFEVEVVALVVDDLAQTQQDITAAVEEWFFARAPYIEGLTVPPRQDRITQAGVAGVVDDIVSAAGGIFGGVNISTGVSPVDAYTLGIGEKAKATVTFA